SPGRRSPDDEAIFPKIAVAIWYKSFRLPIHKRQQFGRKIGEGFQFNRVAPLNSAVVGNYLIVEVHHDLHTGRIGLGDSKRNAVFTKICVLHQHSVRARAEAPEHVLLSENFIIESKQKRTLAILHAIHTYHAVIPAKAGNIFKYRT